MVTKTLTIRKEVYELLQGQKRKNESLSQTLFRVLDEKRMLLRHAGSWKISDAQANAMKRDILKWREQGTRELKEFQ